MRQSFETPYCPVEAVRLQCLGRMDPTMKLADGELWRAFRTPSGPATVHLRSEQGVVHAQAWGDGAGCALDRLPVVSGIEDDPSAFQPRHPQIEDAVRKCPNLSLGRAPRLFDTLVSYVLQQRVAFADAAASWRRIHQQHADFAPGPIDLRVPLSPEQWRSLSPAALASYDVDHQRARIVREVALHARKIDRLDEASLDEARALLPKIRGIGPWTTGIVLGVGRADPDAIPLGDASIPILVSQVLLGRHTGDDDSMLEALEPYRGQRFRVIRLLYAAGFKRQRYAPRIPRGYARRGHGR